MNKAYVFDAGSHLIDYHLAPVLSVVLNLQQDQRFGTKNRNLSKDVLTVSSFTIQGTLFVALAEH